MEMREAVVMTTSFCFVNWVHLEDDEDFGGWNGFQVEFWSVCLVVLRSCPQGFELVSFSNSQNLTKCSCILFVDIFCGKSLGRWGCQVKWGTWDARLCVWKGIPWRRNIFGRRIALTNSCCLRGIWSFEGLIQTSCFWDWIRWRSLRASWLCIIGFIELPLQCGWPWNGVRLTLEGPHARRWRPYRFIMRSNEGTFSLRRKRINFQIQKLINEKLENESSGVTKDSTNGFKIQVQFVASRPCFVGLNTWIVGTWNWRRALIPCWDMMEASNGLSNWYKNGLGTRKGYTITHFQLVNHKHNYSNSSFPSVGL